METFATFRVGGERLSGVLHLPEGARPQSGFACALMLHGFLSDRSGEGRLLTLASRAFAQRGLASLRFDFRGNGDSEGDHAEVTVSREVEDTLAAAAYLRDLPEIDPERVSLLGFSLGGMVAALAAGSVRLHRLALWAPMLPQDLLAFLPRGRFPASLMEVRGLGLSQAFLSELPRLEPLTSLARAGRDTHVFQGEKDQVVPRVSGERYAAAAGAPFSLVPLVGHGFDAIGAREALFDGTWHFLVGR